MSDDIYEPGEIVDITIKGAQVDEVGRNGLHVVMPTGTTAHIELSNYEGVTIERVASAEWPPRPGDLWRDRDGDVWFCRTWQVEGGEWTTGMVCARRVRPKSAFLGGSTPEERILADHGPLTLVHREERDGGDRG